MSKSKKKSVQKKQFNQKKPVKKSRVIAWISAGVVVLAAIIVIVVVNIFSSVRDSQLYNFGWVAASATNSSGDEVDMGEVYKVNYSSYQGTLTFNENGTFSLWLSPGSADDGTHTGVYAFTDDSTIDVIFDDGTVTSFTVNRKSGEIDSIVINYNEYDVYFKKQ